MPCHKDHSVRCGGGWRNSVYAINDPKPPPPPPAPMPPGELIEEYVGCFKDSGDRDLPKGMGRVGRAGDCVERASRRGFSYVGL